MRRRKNKLERRQAHLRSVCENFCRDVCNHLKEKEDYADKENILDGTPSLQEELHGTSLQLVQPEMDGLVTLSINIGL